MKTHSIYCDQSNMFLGYYKSLYDVTFGSIVTIKDKRYKITGSKFIIGNTSSDWFAIEINQVSKVKN